MSPIGSVTRALFYLRVTTLAGTVRSRLRRLKQPKYLAGAVVGVAYVYFFFIRRMQMPPPGSRGAPGIEDPITWTELLPIFSGLGALGLLIAAFASWLIPRRATLTFSEAEIAFLFPAPVSRKALIHYRLLSSQFGLALTALVLTLVLRRGAAMGGHPVMQAVGWWIILATLNLHFTASSFVLARLFNRSLTSARRRMVTIAVTAAIIVALVAWTFASVQPPELEQLRNGSSTTRYITSQLDSGPLPGLLAVPRMVIAPYLSSDIGAFLLALGPALLVLGIHYLWVLRSNVAFEEASVERAEKRAARMRSFQKGDWRSQPNAVKARRAPFTLDDVGRPELAFLWKNLLATSALFSPRGMAISSAVVLALTSWLVCAPPFPGSGGLIVAPAVGVLIIAPLLGPMMSRNDLRADLPNTDILKTYPLRGWQVVLGELLTPIVVITGMVWLALAALAIASARFPLPLQGSPSAILIALAVVAPFITALQLLVPNAVAVLFPAWAQSTADRREHGLEVMGQRLIFVVGQLFVTLIALLPAAIAAGVLFLLANWLLGPVVGILLAALALMAVLGIEIYLGIRWLGARFERFDLSAELHP